MWGVVKKGEVGIAGGTDKEWTEKREVDTQKPFHKGQRQITIMKARKPFFPGFSSAPLSEKETPQPQLQIQNPMEQQTQHRTNRKTPTQKPRRRQFSLLTNAITAFLVSAVLICVPFVPIQVGEGIIDHYCWEIVSVPKKSQPSCERNNWLDNGFDEPNPYCESSGKSWPAYGYCEKVHYHYDGKNYNT